MKLILNCEKIEETESEYIIHFSAGFSHNQANSNYANTPSIFKFELKKASFFEFCPFTPGKNYTFNLKE